MYEENCITFIFSSADKFLAKRLAVVYGHGRNAIIDIVLSLYAQYVCYSATQRVLRYEEQKNSIKREYFRREVFSVKYVVHKNENLVSIMDKKQLTLCVGIGVLKWDWVRRS